MNRRKFLIRLGYLLSSTPLALSNAQVYAAGTIKPLNDIAGITLSDWNKITLVLEHLFPSEPHSPGAKEINATPYLQTVLLEHRQEKNTHSFLIKGLTDLGALCQKLFRQEFKQLTSTQRDEVLKQLEQTNDGYNWINMLLDYIMEALLTDPVYGGNPEGIGWQWLQHQPGFPRPTTALKRRYL
ncbi:MAG: gluconate 2-dehydrogenase subunit 3 family protein [Gammaproteobacteria bacterium]|nr:gluconate 2-dehydrogenase subunit 3 family protein [Gammaproteobacteria bacterium]